MSANEKTIFLIDGSGYIYRAYHAMRHLSTSQGLPTNATYVFTNMLLKLLSEKAPKYMLMAFDVKGPTFRHKMYPAYKANRPPMPENLIAQIPYIKKVVKAMNIASLELPGYEADDIIGTVAKAAQEKGFRVIIVTGDKDFKQLVSSKTTIWDPMKDRATDYNVLKDNFGLEPSQWIDVMGLAGDTSDNIPGVPGIGEKTAIKLINTFGNMEALFENLHKITKKKLHENLDKHHDQAMLSRQLVVIDTKVPLSLDVKSFKMSGPDKKILAHLFKDLEFRRLQKQFPIERDLSNKKYKAIMDEQALTNLIQELKNSKVFSLDLETTSKNPMTAEIVGLSFSCRSNEASYIPLRHTNGTDQLGLNSTLAQLKPLLEDPHLAKGGQNIKYDWIVLQRAGIRLAGVVFDTMVASYLLDPASRTHNLGQIAAEYLDHRMISYKETTGNGKKGFEDVSIEDAVPYACEDADITLMAHKIFKPKLEQGGLKNLYEKVEIPLIPVLVDMQMTGVCVDKDQLEEISKDFGYKLNQIEERIYAVAGEEFNIQSHQQLGRILFEKLKLPIQKKTKKKKGYSTDLEVLTALSAQHELPDMVLQYRLLAKLKSTYADALVNLVHPKTGRIHTSYNQTVTSTGRLSSSEPNLQNIPIRTEEGRKIRTAFIPQKGWLIFSADYSQIELRILAHYSRDPILVEAFKNDQDIHTRTATEVFQLFPSMITPDMRRQAKVINFGIIYGMGPFRLAKELGISQKMAKTYIEYYFARYKGVKHFIDKTIEQARESGFIKTLLERHRWLPDISSANRTAREFAERTAVNTPLQGTAADLIKIAMIRIPQALKEGGLRTKMLLQVHDELVFECPPEEKERATKLVESIMEGVYELEVPLKVNINVGHNWADAH